ncbi:MAG: excalibur calcium-binding domain-containing protein [Schaalia hyovaginalis]|uniref:excalibur calcium-binding domain-containing protein n=1 Tax=Schaalia hyovaginalis TaxID=29316 RepID=UPI0023F6DE4D|nr:excalibur calcium-binding domain-containing protein [Schaalia hyovaginalis]MCI7671317.1 excalibur calcium-binding domain-containing protein [Schaalia hyovaginalis]MDY5506025.1 excalibur calcium-binding domain-containing protein [Schaalia hyovaginalis]
MSPHPVRRKVLGVLAVALVFGGIGALVNDDRTPPQKAPSLVDAPASAGKAKTPVKTSSKTEDQQSARQAARRAEQRAAEEAARRAAAAEAARQAEQQAAEEAARQAEQQAPAPLVSTPSAYYPNCSAARAAGVTPLYAGDPGYSRKLDRDGDGIACE